VYPSFAELSAAPRHTRAGDWMLAHGAVPTSLQWCRSTT